jgi:hypothetical protein
MSLTKPNIPAEILRAFTSGLGDYIDSSEPLWSLLLNKYTAINASNLNLEIFYAIAQADSQAMPQELQRVLAGESLAQTGWRFLAAEGDLYGGCHVGSITPSHPPKLTGFSTATQILTAIESLNGLGPLVPPGNFEPRVLRIPWLQFEAFWLHSADAADKEHPDRIDYNRDYLVPYGGFIGTRYYGLTLMQPFTVEKFFGEIWPRIQEAVKGYLDKQAQEAKDQAKRAQDQADRAQDLIGAQQARARDLQDKAKLLDERAQRLANVKKPPDKP